MKSKLSFFKKSMPKPIAFLIERINYLFTASFKAFPALN